jgi:hypothetical protein
MTGGVHFRWCQQELLHWTAEHRVAHIPHIASIRRARKESSSCHNNNNEDFNRESRQAVVC